MPHILIDSRILTLKKFVPLEISSSSSGFWITLPSLRTSVLLSFISMPETLVNFLYSLKTSLIVFLSKRISVPTSSAKAPV